ncbi:isoprenylcysteine carboxylmethyltransferase family protein [Pseudomonas sp. LFM046]|uniref:methyltransferase family protein n=1 Tax=Pseudomonas sp. LFM046 TaxID=1608357 RepID=UPI0005CFE252|nr:isoprenylcysteine carboxylmethyltransferase family protein [Pseudomonas sp. LFM046]
MNWLEHRLPPPLIAILFALLMWLIARWVPAGEAGGWRIGVSVVVLLAGIAVCVAGILSFRHARTTVNPFQPETATALVSSGIYNHTRNPMYLGFATALVAWSIYLASPIALLGVVGFVLYINRFQIGPEERALEGLFGQSFNDYRARVRRWL